MVRFLSNFSCTFHVVIEANRVIQAYHRAAQFLDCTMHILNVQNFEMVFPCNLNHSSDKVLEQNFEIWMLSFFLLGIETHL